MVIGTSIVIDTSVRFATCFPSRRRSFLAKAIERAAVRLISARSELKTEIMVQ